MKPPKCDELDYINFLNAAQCVFSTVETAETSPDERAPAHDAYTRLLQRLPPDSAALWAEVEPLVQRQQGVLVIYTGQAVCVENGLGDAPLVGQTQTGGARDQSDFVGVDRP
jgi:hypothetical protein